MLKVKGTTLSGRVVAVGSPMLDSYVQVDEAFVATHGLRKGDARPLPLEDFERVLRAAAAGGRSVCTGGVGGVAGNTIKALGRLGNASLAMVGMAGDDEAGRRYAEALTSEYGVRDRLVRTHDAPTGQVLCLITPDGQRTFAFHTGASDLLTPPAVASLPADTLSAGDLVYMDAYTLLCPGQLTESLMATVARGGGVVGFNLCSGFVVEAHRERIRACVQAHVELLVCNEEEAAALTGGAAAAEAAAALGGWCDTVVVTVGEHGCWVGSSRGGEETVIHVACDQPVAAVDTTGAGDFFAAGFVHGWLRGWGVERCVRAGNALGGAVVRTVGTALDDSTWQSLRRDCEELATGEHRPATARMAEG